MKALQFITGLMLVTVLFTQCKKDDLSDTIQSEQVIKNGKMPDAPPKGTFTVKIKNVSTPYDYFAAGAQFIPDGENSAGPAFPGHSFTIAFHAGKGHRLSFATMYGASNDMFYAPVDDGIDLFPGGNPLVGDITNQINLWDAGTEVNGSGVPGTPESEPVEMVSNTEDNIQVLLAYDGTSMFTLTINVKPGSATPLSPVAWVVHYKDQKPIFTNMTLDYGEGLENLAEMGDPTMLSSHLKMHSGYVSPIAPGVWVVHHKNDKPIFTEGAPDYGIGLEQLAEMGDPSVLAASLMDEGYESGVYNTPDGGAEPAPLFPGDSYTFTIKGHAGEYLSFASMLGKSNDLFFAPGEMGIRLFEKTTAVNGNITNKVILWDAGTEPNEYPGAGIHQGPGGTDENGNVRMVNDGFTYPDVKQMIEVTITKN